MRSGRGDGTAVRATTAAVALLLAAGTGLGIKGELGGSTPARPAPARAGAPASVPSSPVARESAVGVQPPAAKGLGPFRRAWVNVPVATVWNDPGTARPEDAPAVSSTPDVSRWVSTLAYRQKLGLDDLLATQALLYQPMFVYGHDGGWDHVLVLGQTGSVYPWGIAGWVPDRQLTYRSPPPAPAHMAVDVPSLGVGGLYLSYGTELPVVPSAAGVVTVLLPTGNFRVAASQLRAGPLPRSGSAVVAQAERFLGLPYLWAGTSAFGYDCSGLTYSVYKMFGITLARDAGDQAAAGAPVTKKDLRPGDLVFFAFDGTIDHVGIYAGNGLMLDSPHTGAAVEKVPLWSPGFAPYYAGARRYL